MKTILWNLAVAAVALSLTLASCQRPIDVDRKTITGRQAIDLMAEGKRYEDEGNYQLALDRYGKALDLAPRPALYYHIGYCYFALGEYAKAHEFLTKAVGLAGDYPAAQHLLSRTRIELALAARRAGTPSRPVPAQPTRQAVAPGKTAVRQPTPPVATRTATPRIESARTPERTAVPTRTPAPPAPTPREVGPVLVSTPPSSVEQLKTPLPTRPGSTVRTPPSAQPNPLPPPIDPKELFQTPEVTDVPPTGLSTGTSVVHPLIGQWQFHWEQARSFYGRSLYREAADELLLVLGQQPRHLEARLLLAKIYDENLGSEEKALEQYERARVLFPNDPRPLFLTGNFYLNRALKGESPAYYDRARVYYSQAITMKPDYYQAHHNMAITYMKQGNYDFARRWFLAALNANPNYAKAHRNLGLLYEEHLKRPKEAIRHYQEYLRLEPDAGDAAEVREWINALQ